MMQFDYYFSDGWVKHQLVGNSQQELVDFQDAGKG